MIHNDKEEFIRILDRASKKKKFLLSLMEKDYYTYIKRESGKIK